LIFVGLATILDNQAIVGEIGHTISMHNRHYFGYVSFVYPFLLVLPFYFLHKQSKITLRRIELMIAYLLLFLSLILLQSILTSDELSGFIGNLLLTSLSSYIGIIGVWLALLLFMLTSFSIILEFGVDDFISIFRFERNKELEQYEQIDDDLFFEDDIKLDAKQPPKPPKQAPKPIIEQEKKTKKTEEEQQKDESHTPIVKELEENKKLLAQIDLGDSQKPKDFKLPSLDFLTTPPKNKSKVNENEIDKKIQRLLEKLRNFKIEGDVIRTYTGPVVTTFEFKPAAHIKVSKILTLQDDLAMALKAQTIRIQAPIPGKDVVGIEIPNEDIETIYLKEILQSEIYQKSKSPLTLVLGKDIVGNPFVTDLKKLPHLLVAGTTGSGKSVGINSMIMSLLYKNSPETLRLIMIDPKMLEFSIYNNIPHLITPVITQAKQAILALSNTVVEMERRYKLMSATKTKNIEGYNHKAHKEGFEPFAYIVVVIDELADLMMTSGKEVEVYIARLAQMARASGIHLIVATQRPSVDVVTGLIKANLPSRISFQVGQKIDSKVILDTLGAESLLGRGDMLFTPPNSSGLVRLHAPFTSEDEIEKVVEYLKNQKEVHYDDSFLKDSNETNSDESSGSYSGELDELYEEAKNIVLAEQKSSISYIQRRLKIGYNRSANIVEQLEQMGILSVADHKGNREIIGS
jgi:S-DNA-T family DNA segregation ATPase FtsK/SpoIIIE